MLVQEHQQNQSPSLNDTLDSQNITLEEKITLKDQAQKSFFNIPNIIIILCLIALVGFGTYSFLNTEQNKEIKSGINNSH